MYLSSGLILETQNIKFNGNTSDGSDIPSVTSHPLSHGSWTAPLAQTCEPLGVAGEAQLAQSHDLKGPIEPLKTQGRGPGRHGVDDQSRKANTWKEGGWLNIKGTQGWTKGKDGP